MKTWIYHLTKMMIMILLMENFIQNLEHNFVYELRIFKIGKLVLNLKYLGVALTLFWRSSTQCKLHLWLAIRFIFYLFLLLSILLFMFYSIIVLFSSPHILMNIWSLMNDFFISLLLNIFYFIFCDSFCISREGLIKVNISKLAWKSIFDTLIISVLSLL